LASTTNTHCVRSLPLLRQWLDAHKAPNQTTPVKIASTEGGYSGSNGTCAPPNVVSEATQANWGTTAINWIVARPSLDFDFFSPFGLINGPNTSYTCSSGYNYQYWQNHLGAVRADGTLKPWFSAYQSLIASSP